VYCQKLQFTRVLSDVYKCTLLYVVHVLNKMSVHVFDYCASSTVVLYGFSSLLG